MEVSTEQAIEIFNLNTTGTREKSLVFFVGAGSVHGLKRQRVAEQQKVQATKINQLLTMDSLLNKHMTQLYKTLGVPFVRITQVLRII